MDIILKRAYEPAGPEDGLRILVERLWPRGVSKDTLALDLWAKEIAPSPGLRTWYGHNPVRWPEFFTRYRAELSANVDEVEKLAALIDRRRATFLFATRDIERNSAVVLRAFLMAETHV